MHTIFCQLFPLILSKRTDLVETIFFVCIIILQSSDHVKKLLNFTAFVNKHFNLFYKFLFIGIKPLNNLALILWAKLGLMSGNATCFLPGI